MTRSGAASSRLISFWSRKRVSMSVEQFYYASKVGASPGGEVGTHLRGASPGLTLEDKQTLTDLVAYSIPPKLNPRQVESHPIALRYRYLAPDKAALLNCQSIGADEHERVGQYFAHALMLPPETFTETPPAFYWRNAFWRVSDDSPGVDLPALDSFDAQPSLERDAVWDFFAEEQRRAWLPYLLAAVIHSASASRRIVIVDTTEHVALWVAGLSLLLPPLYRPLLSFATYHHNPRKADYLITGARSDAGFQLSTSDYLSFFVLDTENARISEGQDSAYARFAADCARPDRYDERLLGLLKTCDHLFPPDGAINERLDDALAYHLRVMANAGPVNPPARRALAIALETLGKGDVTSDGRFEDLQQVYTLLLTALPESPDAELIADYERVSALMLAADAQGAQARLPREMWLATRLIVQGREKEGREIGDVIRRVYGDEMCVASLNSPEYLRELARLSATAPVRAALSVWRFAGKSVKASTGAAPAFTAMLKRAPGVTPAGLTSPGVTFAESLASATSEQTLGWISGLASDATLPPVVVQAYYYAGVRQLPPEARAPYRAQQRDPDRLAVYEIRRDLRAAGAEVNLAIVERWANHAKSQPAGNTWVSVAMNRLWAMSQPRDLPLLAKRALLSEAIVSQLNERSAGVLIREALKSTPLAKPGAEDLAFCERYWQDSRLTPAERALIRGVLAMNDGKLDRDAALELRDRFSQLGPEQYAAESRIFIDRFFQDDVTRESHGEMVAATYSLQYNDAFWASYASALVALMADARTAAKAAQLIGFWFDSSLSALGQFPYVVQMFFIGLPSLFESAQKERGYREAAKEIDQYCANQQWYPLVRNLISPERKSRLGGVFGH